VFVRAFEKLERGVRAALETYSNVHRGTGHHSLITTELYERARNVVLDRLGLDRAEHILIFCTPRQAEAFTAKLEPADYKIASSREVGLPLGLRAIAARKKGLPKGIPFQTGGSVVKSVSADYVIWADAPQKYEAGTPCAMNAIAYAIALGIEKELGTGCFRPQADAMCSASEMLRQDDLLGYSGSELLDELRKQLVGNDLLVPTADGEKPFINLDNAASTPTFFAIWKVVKEIWRQPEKVHSDIVQEVRKVLGAFLGASPDEYETIFTCNTTEALNIAARFVHNEYGDDSETVIVNSLLEHNSNELPWRYMPGASLIRLSVDDEGFVNLDELENLLIKYNRNRMCGRKRIRVVAISGASNVLGTFNDIQAISAIAHEYGARILVDGAQVVAHHNMSMGEWGIDYLALSGHKIYAPFGSGALIVRRDFVCAGRSELDNIRESGEENIVGIAALGKAITLLQRVGMDVIRDNELSLVRRLLNGMSGIPGLVIYGIADSNSMRIHQKGAVVSFSMKCVPHNLVAKELSEQGGIGVRNGCFCAHLLVRHLLNIRAAGGFAANVGFILLPGLTRVFLPGLVRVSLGIENDAGEVDRLVNVLKKVSGARSSLINRLLAFNRNGTPFIPCTSVQEKTEEFLETRVQKVYSSQPVMVETGRANRGRIRDIKRDVTREG
jgi:selenocysteine lyase/cysteine desulfurase